MGKHAFDIVLLDLELPDGNGLDILPDLIRTPSEPEVIIITGTGDPRGAELAFKYGAWDYVQKPFLMEEVALPITRAIEYHREKLTPRRVPLKRLKIIGNSDAIQKALDEVGKASATDASVLIIGETGKELFAKAVHENSTSTKTAEDLRIRLLLLTAVPCQIPWWKALCSAMKKAPLQEPLKNRTDFWSRPTGEPCSWMKSEISP